MHVVTPQRLLLVNRRVAEKLKMSNRVSLHTLLGMAHGVLTVDNLHTSTVASVFCLASPRSFFIVRSLSYRATNAPSLTKDPHNTPTTTCSIFLPLTRLSILLPTNVEMDLWTRRTIPSRLSTRLASTHLCYTVHERTRQCRPPQVLPALQWAQGGGSGEGG